MLKLRIFGTALIAAAVLTACGGTASDNSGGVNRDKGSKGTLKIADAGFTESEVMANMYADVLAKAGYKVTSQSFKSSDQAEQYLKNGQIAVIPEYVATYADQLNKVVNGPNAPSVASADLNKSYAALKKYAAMRNQVPLKPSKAVDQNAFAVSKAYAKQHNLKTLSDLGKSGLSVKLAAGNDCLTRPLCEPGLKKTYGIKVSKIDPLGVDTPQSKQAVKQGADQLALVLTTDATVGSSGLVILKDDKGLQPSDYLVPIVNKKKLTPDIEKALNNLSSKITTAELAKLNSEVDQGQQKPGEVASNFLKSKNLI